MSRRGRTVLGGLAALALVLPLVWMWWSSLLPSTYSVMDMGYLDRGGAPAPATAAGAHGEDTHGGTGAGATVSVADLVTDPDREADVVVDLVARQERFTLASGREVDGYTVNGRSPGPQITARVGQLVEVHLHNESVAGGMTLHWHGIDVPNAEDGVAGVTQDAVGPGEEHTYRWVAPHVGTYWYHSHQVSHEQVAAGLLGTVVVLPRDRGEEARDPALDVVAVSHLYDGVHTVNGLEGDQRVPAPAGSTVRVRVVNTDNGQLGIWADADYRVLAHDGYDVRGPTAVEQQLTDVPAGGRVDVEVRVPEDGTPVRLQLGAATALVLGPASAGASSRPVPQPSEQLDLLSYGRPGPPPFDAEHPDREFTYSIGRRPGFVDGRPGMWWSVNGHLYPDLPMFVVRRGDVVVVHLENHSGDVHPMHLHGHHAVVLARDGTAATGSPWWFDSLDVRDDESYDVAFVADNPGVWMDHCHNLEHAAQGLVTHLMYEGVTEPYLIGEDSGNEPE